MIKRKKPRAAARGDGAAQTPVPAVSRRRPRQKRWNDTLRALFIEELYETCCVREALRKTGMSAAGLYKHRAKNSKFRQMWDDALDAGYAMLESEMLERARHGHDQQVVGKNGEIIRVRVISNRLGLALLKLHSDRVAKIRAERDSRPFSDDAEAARSEMLQRLDMMNLHLRRKYARAVEEAANAEALRWHNRAGATRSNGPAIAVI